MAEEIRNATHNERITAIRDRRNKILSEIEDIRSSSPIESSRTHRLRKEYNSLVDEEEEAKLQIRVDPLKALPPELWPAIFPGSTKDRLILTLVCNRWRDAILSVPTLWTYIELDERSEDYLAQAIASFALSEPLDVSLTIILPMETWKDAAPLIAAKSARISHLQINSFDVPEAFALRESFEILSYLGDLPHLQSVHLPGYYYMPPLLEGDTYTEDQAQGQYPEDETLLMRAPLLVKLYALFFTTKHLLIPAVTKLETIHIRSFHQDAVEALGHFHDLKHLTLVEERDPYRDDRLLPHSLESSLSSITSFDYHGLALSRALRCIGRGLVSLSARYVSMRQLPEILVTLRLFPQLYRLHLDIDTTGADPFVTPSSDTLYLLSIKWLQICFHRGLERWDSSAEEKAKRRLQARIDLFRYLVVIMPHVEEVLLYGQDSDAPATTYIQSLRKLRILSFSSDSDDVESPPFSLSTDQLESADWSGVIPSRGIFNVLPSSTIRTLAFLERTTYRLPFAIQSHKGPTLSRYRVLSTPLPNLCTLTITVRTHLSWDLRIFPKLKRIRLSNVISALTGDFLEVLLLQPALCPSLEEICITGVFVEWDLLILMLERRNFISIPGVTHIKIIELGEGVSYKLLRPISRLLGGRYSFRESNTEYSSIAIGRLLWDPSL